jgi:hypothetical protein
VLTAAAQMKGLAESWEDPRGWSPQSTDGMHREDAIRLLETGQRFSWSTHHGFPYPVHHISIRFIGSRGSVLRGSRVELTGPMTTVPGAIAFGVQAPSANDAKLCRTRWRSSVIPQGCKRLGGRIVGWQPGDKPLLVDFIR